PVDELDADLIEDVTIEMNQARETTNIYTNILDSTMETYASIINNNTNNVMKTMTSISIVLMFPTLVASLFGMNLINGMENSWWGFPLVTIISLSFASGAFWLFRKMSWI
ncbi:MAG: magnesium transporter CorA family protein, partial [Prevotellaceae bacterium]|nr:magnesium transporter CorA family protein [Candidatus Faecinaster equi]